MLSSPVMFQTAIPPYSQTPNFSKKLPLNIPNYQNLIFPNTISQNGPLAINNKLFNLPNAEYNRNDKIFSSAEMKITPKQHHLLNKLEESKTTALDNRQYNFEEKVIDKILTHLPQLAATVLKMSNSDNKDKTKYYSTTPNSDLKPSALKFTEDFYTKSTADEVASIVNELPSTFFLIIMIHYY